MAALEPTSSVSADEQVVPSLYRRLSAHRIALPPLRERREDIPLLVQHFLDKLSAEAGRPPVTVSQDVMRRLMAHPWPGNVRELQHAVERAVVLSDGDVLGPSDLSLGPARAEAPDTLPDRLDLEQIERSAVLKALSKHGGNISHASAELGLTRKSLYRRIEKYGL